MKKTENKSGKSGMQVMKKLMAFIGNYKIFLGLSIVLAAVTVILQLYIPILFGDAIDEVVAAHQVNFPEMWFYLKRIVFFTLVSALSAWIMNLINNRTASCATFVPRRSVISRCCRCPIWISTAPETS